MSNEQNPTELSKLVIVGSLHYDLMIDAPHRPRTGETVAGSKWYPKFGGKGGNQAIAASLLSSVRFVGAVGSDGFSDFLLDSLSYHHLSTNWITRLPTNNTGMSVAITDSNGDYGAVIVSGANADINPDHITDPLLWDGANMLILQNEIPEKMNLLAAKQAKKHGVQVCLNAAPSRSINPELFQLLDILVVNGVEAEDMSNIQVNSLETAKKAAKFLTKDVPVVVVTAGGDGVALVSQSGECQTLAAKKVTLISTHGAGDAFVGTFCAMLSNGYSLEIALQTANDTAAIHVSINR